MPAHHRLAHIRRHTCIHPLPDRRTSIRFARHPFPLAHIDRRSPVVVVVLGGSQYRNVHVLLGDFNSEVPLYQQSGALVDELLAWRPAAPSLPGRLEELYIRMYELNIVGANDVALVQAWISDLLRLGYRFPAVRPGPAGADPW